MPFSGWALTSTHPNVVFVSQQSIDRYPGCGNPHPDPALNSTSPSATSDASAQPAPTRNPPLRPQAHFHITQTWPAGPPNPATSGMAWQTVGATGAGSGFEMISFTVKCGIFLSRPFPSVDNRLHVEKDLGETSCAVSRDRNQAGSGVSPAGWAAIPPSRARLTTRLPDAPLR